MAKEKVLVTGGAGYAGSVLVPKLLGRGLDVRILDLMIFGDKGIRESKDRCEIVRGDIRDSALVDGCLHGVEYVIHLASIANDPCANLNPELTERVNYKATENLARLAKENGTKRFIFSSSSSVYGIREEEDVTEELELRPLTVYSKTKAMAEEAIRQYNDENFTTVSIRSATICGYSPRLRLDLVVNIFAADAILKREIGVNGGEQKRPNVHIEDITELYANLLYVDKELISGEVFNYGKENHSLNQIAEIVRGVVGEDVKIKKNPKTADSRSYHISSDKIEQKLGIFPSRNVRDAVVDLKEAFETGKVPCPEDKNYRNVARMKEIDLR
jgi:nucleoside-diphosphate-sugar epimerase